MTTKTVTNGQLWRDRGLSGVIAAVLTLTGFAGYQQVYPPRPDPFTGQQAEALRLEIKDDLRREVEKINKAAKERHQDMINRLDRIDARDQRRVDDVRRLWGIVRELPPDWYEEKMTAVEGWIIRQDPSYKPPPKFGRHEHKAP